MRDEMPRGRSRTVSDAELLEAGRQVDGPAWGAAEVASRVDIGKEGVRQRLNALVEADEVCVKQVSGQNIYWLPHPAGQDSAARTTEDTCS